MTTQQIRESTIKIGVWYVEQFEKDNSFMVECLVKFSAIRKIMIMVYHSLIVEGKILPIEKLELSQKLSLWEDAKEFASGRLGNNECIELSKALFVFKVL